MNASVQQPRGVAAYRAGAAVALATAFVTLWTMIVRDDDHGLGSIAVVMAAGVGAFAARFRAAGLARAMAGVAIMQACVGVAIATAPVVAIVPGASSKVLVLSGGLMLMWMLSAALFRASAKARSPGAFHE